MYIICYVNSGMGNMEGLMEWPKKNPMWIQEFDDGIMCVMRLGFIVAVAVEEVEEEYSVNMAPVKQSYDRPMAYGVLSEGNTERWVKK